MWYDKSGGGSVWQPPHKIEVDVRNKSGEAGTHEVENSSRTSYENTKNLAEHILYCNNVLPSIIIDHQSFLSLLNDGRNEFP